MGVQNETDAKRYFSVDFRGKAKLAGDLEFLTCFKKVFEVFLLNGKKKQRKSHVVSFVVDSSDKDILLICVKATS